MKFLVQPNISANRLTIKFERLQDVVKVLLASEKVVIEQSDDEIDDEERRAMQELKDYEELVRELIGMMSLYGHTLTPLKQTQEESKHQVINCTFGQLQKKMKSISQFIVKLKSIVASHETQLQNKQQQIYQYFCLVKTAKILRDNVERMEECGYKVEIYRQDTSEVDQDAATEAFLEEGQMQMLLSGPKVLYGVNLIGGLVPVQHMAQLQKFVFRKSQGQVNCFFQFVSEDDLEALGLSRLETQWWHRQPRKSIFVLVFANEYSQKVLQHQIQSNLSLFECEVLTYPTNTLDAVILQATELKEQLKGLREEQDKNENMIKEYLRNCDARIDLLQLLCTVKANKEVFKVTQFLELDLVGNNMQYVQLTLFFRQDHAEAVYEYLHAHLQINQKQLVALPDRQPPYVALPDHQFQRAFSQLFLDQPLYRPGTIRAEMFLMMAMVMLAVGFHDFLLPMVVMTVTLYSCVLVESPFPFLRDHRFLIMVQSVLIMLSAFLYNDFNIFGTCYLKGNLPSPPPKGPPSKGPPAQKIDYNCVYPFGVDPIWFLSVNNGAFQYEMRFKQILMLGLFMNLVVLWARTYNKNFKQALHFYPQMLLLSAFSIYAAFLTVFHWTEDGPHRQKGVFRVLFNSWRIFSAKPQPILFSSQSMVEMVLVGSVLIYGVLLHVLHPFKMLVDYLLDANRPSLGHFLFSLAEYHCQLNRLPWDYLTNLCRFMLLFVLNVLQMHVSIGSTFFLSGLFHSPQYKVSSYLAYYLIYALVQVILLLNALLLTYYLFSLLVVRPLTLCPDKHSQDMKHSDYLRRFQPESLSK